MRLRETVGSIKDRRRDATPIAEKDKFRFHRYIRQTTRDSPFIQRLESMRRLCLGRSNVSTTGTDFQLFAFT